MNMRLRGMSLLAAAAIAGAGLVTAPQAFAATPMQDILCTPGKSSSSPSEPKCSITALGSITEGQTVKADVTGTPGKVVKVRAYAVRDGKLYPVGPEASASIDTRGYANDVEVKVDPLKAPINGGMKSFTVQVADLPAGAPATGLVVGTGSSTGHTTFSVYSSRANVVMWSSGANQTFTPGSEQFVNLDQGITNQKFAVQIQVGGQWKTLNNNRPDNGVIGSTNKTTVWWNAIDLPKGNYPFRILNLTTSDVIWEGQYLANGAAPTTAPAPGGPKPTAAPTTPAKKDTQGGLAKTGH